MDTADGAVDWDRRWNMLWRGLELGAPPVGAAAILARWSERHRAYHTVQHLAECLRWLDRVRADAVAPGAVELAVWYHDLVYRPLRGGNEEASAEVAIGHLAAAGASPGFRHVVHRLILATAHRAPPEPGDAALLVDIDLAILGAPPERFAEYERQIRREYRRVPDRAFRAARARVLGGFRDRARIYATPRFASWLEAAARRNLDAAVAALGEGPA